MKIIPYEDLIAVDIDETLVMWQNEKDETGEINYNVDLILTDPYGVLGKIYLKKNKPNINLVKRKHAQGQKFFAWTMAGVKWAELVIKSLKLEDYFEFVIIKPVRYIDDKDVSQWMVDRTWFPADFTGWQSDKHNNYIKFVAKDKVLC